jgi:hypothetical protein
MGGVGSEPMIGARGGNDCDRMDTGFASSPPRPRPAGRGIAIGFDLAVGLGSTGGTPLPEFDAGMAMGGRADMGVYVGGAVAEPAERAAKLNIMPSLLLKWKT